MGKEIIEKLGYVKNREDGKKGKDYKVLDGMLLFTANFWACQKSG